VATLLVLGLMASLSYAAVGAAHREQHASTAAPKDDADECSTTGGEPEESDDQEDQGEDCEAEDTEDDSGENGDADSQDSVDPDREASCNEAAGIDPNAKPEPGDDTEKATGLDNAIQHVLANCLKNPQAPGLVNALEHLVANQERHELHDEWRAQHEHGKPPWAGGGPPPWAGGGNS
jgi:hypothetical protein